MNKSGKNANGNSRTLIATRRQNFKHNLALGWIRIHRPDVWDMIQAETDKAFPGVHERERFKLPESLQSLK